MLSRGSSITSKLSVCSTTTTLSTRSELLFDAYQYSPNSSPLTSTTSLADGNNSRRTSTSLSRGSSFGSDYFASCGNLSNISSNKSTALIMVDR